MVATVQISCKVREPVPFSDKNKQSSAPRDFHNDKELFIRKRYAIKDLLYKH